MQLAAQIDQQLINSLPMYQEARDYALGTYQQALTSISSVYEKSTQQVSKAKKMSKQFQRNTVWMMEQSAEDLLDIIETKLKIEKDQEKDLEKTQRAIRIIEQLKSIYILQNFEKLSGYGQQALVKGKELNSKYIIPIYIKVKASLLVSWEIMMETVAERLGQLKMSYKVSKDTVTMLFDGEFEEKMVANISQKLGCFKQLTINFVQKGMEIKISKKDLYENFRLMMEKLTESMKEIRRKGEEEWTQTREKTVSMYNSILNRIKEKEIQIRGELTADSTLHTKTE